MGKSPHQVAKKSVSANTGAQRVKRIRLKAINRPYFNSLSYQKHAIGLLNSGAFPAMITFLPFFSTVLTLNTNTNVKLHHEQLFFILMIALLSLNQRSQRSPA